MGGDEIQGYIAKTKGADTQSSKASLFSKLVEDLFGERVDVDPAADVFPELKGHMISEKGTLAVRCEDTPGTDLIVEFRTAKLDPLRSKEIIERAEDQLRRYAYLIRRERGEGFRCLLTASDGVRNFAYRPSEKENLESLDLEGRSPFAVDKKLRKSVELERVGYKDFSRGDPEKASRWLERLITGRLSDG